MTYQESIETQMRQAVERLIIDPPDEQHEYLQKLATLAASLAKEKQYREQPLTEDKIERIRRDWFKGLYK